MKPESSVPHSPKPVTAEQREQAEENLKAVAATYGFDWNTLKSGIEKLLPLAETLARITANPYDDMVVTFLKIISERN